MPSRARASDEPQRASHAAPDASAHEEAAGSLGWSAAAPPGPGLGVPGVLALQRTAGNAATAAFLSRRAAGGGQPTEPLPPPTAERMGEAFGRDFGDVRVHPESDKAGGRVQAVTEGSDVHFGPGAYAPGTETGDRLIAHELAHVVQQSGEQGIARSAEAALEADAERAAAAAARGEHAEVLLGAEPGAPQRYEGYEHQDLGNAYGGEGIVVTTQTGVRLTYGDMVALSGDFARSPEQLMTMAPAELNALLTQIHGERTRADAGLTQQRREEQQGLGLDPMGTEGAIAEGNLEYEITTRWYRQLAERGIYVPQERWDTGPQGGGGGHHHHDHSEEDEGEGHGEEHAHDERGDDLGPSGGTVAGHGHGEHVEDAGPPGRNAETPGADESFLSLASHNTSHFSPENISNNFKPGHMEALRAAQRAWQARNPDQTPTAIPGADFQLPARNPGESDTAYRTRVQPALEAAPEPGAAPSARMGTAPHSGVSTEGAPAATDTSHAGPPTEARSVDARSTASGDADEARAWMLSAFSGHFLTDAFASGHLVNGRIARTAGETWFNANKGAVYGHLADLIRAREGSNPIWAHIEAQALGRLFEQFMEPRGIAMRMIHDTLNRQGIQVRNAKGTEWTTVGDNQLGASPDTRIQAQLSAKSARDKVQEAVQTGTSAAPYEALDYIPDVASIRGGPYLPIAEFARAETTFSPLFEEQFLRGDYLYKLIKDYLPAIANVAKRQLGALPGMAVDWVKQKAGEVWGGIKSFFGGVVDRGRELVGGAIERGREVVGHVVDTGRQVVSGISDFVGGLWDRASQAVSGAVERGREAVDGAIETGREVVERVQSTISSLVERGAQTASGIKDAVVSGAKQVASGIGGFLRSAWSRGREAVGGAIETGRGLVERGREAVSGAVETGREIVGGAIDRGLSIAGGIRERISSAVDSVREFFTRRLQTGDQGVTPLAGDAQRYAHGGFMGAAGTMMQDGRWREIYRTLMPDHYEQAAGITDPAKLMAHMENNPVLAAYGSMRHQQEVAGQDPHRAPDEEHRAMNLEWDVWLPPDPAQVTDLSQVRIAHGGLVTTVGENLSPGFGHGREDVQGAPTGSDWMSIYGRAIAMARGTPESAPGSEGEAEQRRRQLQQIAQTTTVAEAESLTLEYLGSNGGLILDVKSTYSTPGDVARFVAMLRERGINVMGVGTFKFSQLGALPEGVSRTKFFHGLHDLENAVRRGQRAPGDGAGGEERDDVVEQGDTVMFNAGALLREQDGHFAIDQPAFQMLVAMQQSANLQIGLYVQETAASPEAIDVITQLVNSRRDVFALGFAYGHVSGHAESEVSGSGFGMQKWEDRRAAVSGAAERVRESF